MSREKGGSTEATDNTFPMAGFVFRSENECTPVWERHSHPMCTHSHTPTGRTTRTSVGRWKSMETPDETPHVIMINCVGLEGWVMAGLLATFFFPVL